MPSDIKTSLPPIYLFHGADTFSIAEKMAEWKTHFREKYGSAGLSVFDADETGSGSVSRGESVPDPVSSLKNALSSYTLFSTTSLVIVKNVFSKKAEQVRELLCTYLPAIPVSTFVVMIDEKRDQKSELSKLLTQLSEKGACKCEEFIPPQGSALRKWISQRAATYGGSFDSTALTAFCRALEQKEYIGDDTPPLSLWHLDNEVRKLVSLSGGRPICSMDIRNISCLPVSAHIFDLSDALTSGNEQAALRHAHLLEPLMRTLQFLITQFRGFLIVKSMEEDRQSEIEISRILGWNPKRVWVIRKKLAHHTTTSLKTCYASLLDLERQLKTGATEPSLALDLFIGRITKNY
ncbi:MAG: hypothetical protein AAB855_03080 [Patescibacteria group bacterium]|mgnify:CR=1 FL=1